MNINLRTTLAWVLGTVLLVQADTTEAQNRSNWVGTPGVERDWDEGDQGAGEGINWASSGTPSEAFQPDRNFSGGEYGSISNGGIALIDHALGIFPTDIRLGETGGSTGSLVIRDGGSISVEAVGSTGLGELRNGNAGSGTLVLRGNMGTVNLQRYTQAGSSALVAEIVNASSFANRVQVSQAITLNGTLRVDQAPGSSFKLSSGNSWTIMQGAPVSGNFSNVQVDPALRSNAGQVVGVSTTGNAVTLSVEQRLVLQVDRFTGETKLINPAGHSTSISLINYTLSSPNNGLDSSASRWLSFTDDAGKPGWFEANPTSNNLSELNPMGQYTFAAGTSHNFGTPINANTAAPLGTNRVNVADVSMRYQLPNGTYLNAVVEPVGRFNDLVLVVNPDTGLATIQNQSTQAIEFISYTIHSASGSLETSYAGLSALPGSNWFKGNPTANNLSELNPYGSAAMSSGDDLELGIAWDTAGAEDLTFSYQTPDGALRTGTVNYGDLAVIDTATGDFDGDGDVDGRDFLLWQRGGSPNSLSAGDLALWRSQYGTSGDLQAAVAAVPEPSAGVLFLSVVAFVVGRKRGQV